MRQVKKQYLATIMFFCVMLSSPSVVHAEEMIDELDSIISEVSAETAAGDETGPQVMVSLGDSYSSGEGIEPFYHQDDSIFSKVKEDDWLAHRSQKCWSGQLKLPRNDEQMSAYKEGDDIRWYFVATSGAETVHFTDDFKKTYIKGAVIGSKKIPAQFAVFDSIEPGTVDYVTLTIGGNDVNFADIITECLLEGVPVINRNKLHDRVNQAWDKFDNGDEKSAPIKDLLKSSYETIADKAGPQAHILVAGYPTLLSKDKEKVGNITPSLLIDENIDYVNEQVTIFNSRIQNIVDDCRSKDGIDVRFVGVADSFAGHEAYSKDPYINSVIILPRKQDIQDKPPSAYSVHPNEQGAKVYAACVQDAIDEIEAGGPSSGGGGGGGSDSLLTEEDQFFLIEYWNKLLAFMQKWFKLIEEQALDVIDD